VISFCPKNGTAKNFTFPLLLLPPPPTWIVIPSQVFSTGLLWKTLTCTHTLPNPPEHFQTLQVPLTCSSLFSWSAQWIMCLFLFGIRPKAFLDHHCSMVSKQTNNIYIRIHYRKLGQFLKVHTYLCTPMNAYIFLSLVGGKSLIIYEKPIFLRTIIIIVIVLPSFPTDCDLSIEFRP
jgi:hypothetical protein